MAASKDSAGHDAPAEARLHLVRRGGVIAWLGTWWRIILLGAHVLALLLSPGTYSRAYRRALARHIYLGTAPQILWFTVLSSLISLVVIRIVMVTAQSYGLSQYALQMVVRVLVLELIPLTAAVFVALRVGIPDGAEVAAQRAQGRFEALRAYGTEAVVWEVAPRVVAGVFAVLTLASISGVITLVLAYLSVYGFAAGALEQYTRTVGQVFHPALTLVFVVKTLLLSLAVGLIPVGSALYDAAPRRTRASAEMSVLVRLFLVILLIEAASLVGNYY